MFCVRVVAARPKTRMSTDTTSSIPVTMMDFLFLFLKEPERGHVLDTLAELFTPIISWREFNEMGKKKLWIYLLTLQDRHSVATSSNISCFQRPAKKDFLLYVHIWRGIKWRRSQSIYLSIYLIFLGRPVLNCAFWKIKRVPNVDFPHFWTIVWIKWFYTIWHHMVVEIYFFIYLFFLIPLQPTIYTSAFHS